MIISVSLDARFGQLGDGLRRKLIFYRPTYLEQYFLKSKWTEAIRFYLKFSRNTLCCISESRDQACK